LQADLALWTEKLKSAPPQIRAGLLQMLQQWQREPALAGVRDDAALLKLPEAEQPNWRTLWAELEALRKKPEAPKNP
jgi:hypothetical protein